MAPGCLRGVEPVQYNHVTPDGAVAVSNRDKPLLRKRYTAILGCRSISVGRAREWRFHGNVWFECGSISKYLLSPQSFGVEVTNLRLSPSRPAACPAAGLFFFGLAPMQVEANSAMLLSRRSRYEPARSFTTMNSLGGPILDNNIKRHRTRASRGRTLLFRALAVTLSVAVCWAILEVFLRIFPVDQAPPLAEHPMMDRGYKFIYPAEERLHPYTEDGFEMLRVGLIGDSFTAGAGCDPEDTYGMRLERMLNYNAGQLPARVDIFAKGGTAPPSQIQMLEQALALKPDLVCLGICLNDAEDWAHQDLMNALRDGMMPKLPPDWFRPILRHSHVLHLAFQKWGALRVRNGFRKYFHDIWEEESQGAQVFFAALAEMQMLCAEAEVPFCAMVFPMFSYDLSPDGYAFRDVHERICARLGEMEIPCLDLFPIYEGRSPERLQAFPGYDGHPNEIAHRLAAQELLFFLIDRELIDSGYRPKLVSSSMDGYYGKLYRRVADPAAYRQPVD